MCVDGNKQPASHERERVELAGPYAGRVGQGSNARLHRYGIRTLIHRSHHGVGREVREIFDRDIWFCRGYSIAVVVPFNDSYAIGGTFT